MAADPMTRRTVDDLFQEDDFDWDDDPFADRINPTSLERDDKAVLSPRKRKAEDDKENFGLGLDEEIKIAKKRKPIAKLDAEKLLSQPGIPKIREIVRGNHIKKKLKLKGKGHEFSDCARLLKYYQLWADNLYPRAKFADALTLIEKAGHTKRMQVMRKAWIDEGKPSYNRDQDFTYELQPTKENGQNEDSSLKHNTVDILDEDVPDDDAMFFADINERSNIEDVQVEPDDDELDALLAQEDEVVPLSNIGRRSNMTTSMQEDSEGEDDLDALLAAETEIRRGNNNRLGGQIDSQDDLDAIPNEKESFELDPSSIRNRTVDEEDDEDDLDALLNEDSFALEASTSKPFPDLTIGRETSDIDLADALPNTTSSSQSEPELPSLPTAPNSKIDASNTVSALPGSSEVPELVSNVISSSPIPNIYTDDLDAMMDEMDNDDIQEQSQKSKVSRNGINVHTPSKDKRTLDLDLGGDILSSSPIPNKGGD